MALSSFTSGAELFAVDKERETGGGGEEGKE